MNDLKVLALLRKIDGGYAPTKKEIRELSQVEEVTWKRIDNIPECIDLLRGLKRLSATGDILDGSVLKRLPEGVWNLASLQSLELSKTAISDLPERIGDLKSLQSLNLSMTAIRELPESIGNLKSLQSLDLNRTEISELPESIGDLKGLQSLNLSRTVINELPESIGDLKSLQRLDLNRLAISELPERIGDLKNLQSLNLSRTAIRELPERIKDLKSLQSLDLNRAAIRGLPESIGDLKSLQNLNLSRVAISELPERIGDLKSLQSLDLSRTAISELPESIGNLTNLQNLNLRVTKISKLPSSIGNLISLQMLDLSYTQISTLPSGIRNLKSLRDLILSGVTITELPDSIGGLGKLRNIVLNNCIFNTLPRNLLLLNLDFLSDGQMWGSRKSGIYINNMRLRKQPVSLFSQPRELIEDYYRQPKTAINETKVIFLGSEGVGKTHTIKRILNDNAKISETLKETPGISIEFKDFVSGDTAYRINFWDFGGQEIMHAMHRCFLTDRTGYVVVVSTRFGDVNKQARYWLKNIESFAPGAPVVIYVNKWSDGTYYQIDEYSLRRDYPNIIDVKQCSAKDGDDNEFRDVVASIQKMALANDSIEMLFPANWENVRQEIIKLGKNSEKKYYISQQEFREICRLNGVENHDIQTWLLDWFNDLGECFSYQLEDGEPAPDKNLKILNPEWLTNTIYIIIREAGDLAVNGFISHEGIRNKLDHSDKGTLRNVSYSETECDYVLNVMRKFRLSYKVPGQAKEFIPALLREQMPSDLEIKDYKKVISYEMEYKYLPENVLHNLMILMYPYLDHSRCWLQTSSTFLHR